MPTTRETLKEAAAQTADFGSLQRLATVIRCKTGDTIYHCRDSAEYWYRMVAGAGRNCALTSDGCRHIVDFLLPGDLFGFGTRDTHSFSVEAIVSDTVVARYPRYQAERLAESDPVVARLIREVAFESVTRLQKRMVILGRTSALEKVSSFLLEMADRCGSAQSNAVLLPMSRYDIADYLAIAVETVSRTLTELRERGLITFAGVRRIRICDRDSLENITESRMARVSRGVSWKAGAPNGSSASSRTSAPPSSMVIRAGRPRPLITS
jgi:CRP/FNR family transcriptional regulator, nitrogen fixation regulation protein